MKTFIEPEMEIQEFEIEDIITTSELLPSLEDTELPPILKR